MINHYCTEINRILLEKRKIQQLETEPVKKIHGTLNIAKKKSNVNII